MNNINQPVFKPKVRKGTISYLYKQKRHISDSIQNVFQIPHKTMWNYINAFGIKELSTYTDIYGDQRKGLESKDLIIIDDKNYIINYVNPIYEK